MGTPRPFTQCFLKSPLTPPYTTNVSYPLSLHPLLNSPSLSLFLLSFVNLLIDKWASVENRRTFFEKYAETCGFDPQIPTNWYRESRKGRILAVKVTSITSPTLSLLSFTLFYYPLALFGLLANCVNQGFRGVLFYHDGSFRKALLDLFPNIGLERSKFQKIRCMLPSLSLSLFPCSCLFRPPLLFVIVFVIDAWSKPEVRRRMLEQYARKNKFDPLVADNWYMQCALRIQLSKVCLPPSPSPSSPYILPFLSLSFLWR